jgi:hypothetical protein
MNRTSRTSDPGAGDRLDLPACPICHEKSAPSRHQASVGGADYVWYECEACGSALLSLGDGSWAYQKITRRGHEHLLRKPLTLPDLRRLLPTLAPPRPVAAAAAFPEPMAPPPPVAAPAAPPRVEPARPAPEPAVPVVRGATSLEALRANLHVEEDLPRPPAPEADAKSAVSRLPFPFVVAAITLIVLLIAGLGLVLLLGLWPT